MVLSRVTTRSSTSPESSVVTKPAVLPEGVCWWRVCFRKDRRAAY
jgi:hypothetical protein